ncbi:IQ and RasGAP domain protein [Rhizoctonia solani 123E]|uniref:IQ and RasGAP domain protein n=1 Tax=Rhizoctonia solani 123E TaxID=1423351 RepID=A0A074T1C0_9AGAM|nr:IQ and RasGAP domain protein [Rhizoctonia solani 123E]
MDRSNSTASTSSAASALSRTSSKTSATGLTSYQERLLERTSSLNRTASQNTQNTQNRGIFASPAGGPPPARRWAPSHRVSASVDTARARWESRGEEPEGETTPMQSPTRPMSSAVENMIRRNASGRSTSSDSSRIPVQYSEAPTSDDPQTPIQRPPSRTVEDILRRHDLLNDNPPESPTRAYARLAEAPNTPPGSSNVTPQAASITSRSRVTPSFLKRRTLPDPIAVSSYLPEDGQPSSLPPTVSPPVSSPPAPASPTKSYQPRSLERPEPATLGRTFRTPSSVSQTNVAQPLETATLGRRFGINALSNNAPPDSAPNHIPPMNGPFDPSQPTGPSPPPERIPTLGSRRGRSQSVDILAQAEAVRKSFTPEPNTPAWIHSRGSLRRTGGVRPGPLSPSKIPGPESRSPVLDILPSSPSKAGVTATPLSPTKPFQSIVTPASPVKAGFTPLSPTKPGFSSPAPDRPVPSESSERTENIPIGGSATLKRNKYGPALSAGRKLGRHLPRIASGDGGDDWEEHRSKPPEELAREKREREREERRKLLEEKREREREVRERRRTLQGHNLEEELPPPLPASAALPPPSAAPAGADDVAGIPGRLRLTRDTVPMPSSRLMGNWADSQRKNLQAYEYLCHVGEAQQWIEGCLGMELGFGVVEMDEGLRNGVVLARLAKGLGEPGEGDIVRKIFEHPTLHYRHTDNINYFLAFVRNVGLPMSFEFDTIDLYEKKNIPKVIYCIHALSHLLSRRGRAERIGNLLGQLEFSDDQLAETQKGLAAAGVNLPNFKSVGNKLAQEINEEPEVEVETEDERRDRLLLENEASIVALQAQARGYLVRRLQEARQSHLRLAERSLMKLQARGRGFLQRQKMSEARKQQADLDPWVHALQAACRTWLARRYLQARLARVRSASQFAVCIQAQVRGVLERRRYARLKSALRSSKISFVGLQAYARAKIARRAHHEAVKSLHEPIVMHGVVGLQATCRGVLIRMRVARDLYNYALAEPMFVALQAHVRGVLVRRRIGRQLKKLDDATDVVVNIQAAARAFLARRDLLSLIRGLRKASPFVVGLQALARANLARRRHQAMAKALGEVKVLHAVGGFQTLARAALARRKHLEQKKELGFCKPNVVGLQAAARGALVRNFFWAWRDYLHGSQPEAIYLQSLLRGALQRRKFCQKMQYFRDNLHKVVKIQSLFRAKEQREQYRQLTMGKNVNVGTIKNFVHLLDDSEADFEDEIRVEWMRKQVVEGIRENQSLETEVNELDTKIALVVQNVKTFEELIKARRMGTDSTTLHTTRASVLAAHGDPFAAPNALDQQTMRRLELYQQLFYLLQTQGGYLARLFFSLSRSKVAEKNKRTVERVVLTLFGYGQESREDYLLLKLFQMSILEEVSAANTIQDIIQSHPMYLSVAIQYIKHKQTAYIRDTLKTIIKEVIEMEGLDLETDPVVIYKTFINQEEMRTGQQSVYKKDVTTEEAMQHHATREKYIHHLQKLQWLSGIFVRTIMGSTKRMPYAMRLLAREILAALRSRFPNEQESFYAIALGRLIYYRYINPAIITPETYDVVPTTITPAARRNLADISKVLTQISSGSEFEVPNLASMNAFVTANIPAMSAWFLEVADVVDAETEYHAHEFIDVTVQPKPVYISPNEIYAMHGILTQNVEQVASGKDDPIRAVLTELVGPPTLSATTDELKDARDRAVTLELSNRFAQVKDPHAEEKAIWVQAKRGVLAILRVQPAKDLVESLMKPVTEGDEYAWEDIVDKELVTDRMLQKRRLPSQGAQDSAYRLEDIRTLSFREVKARAIQYLLELEKRDKVTRTDGYQGILNAIANDVRSKHRKRVQRKREMDNMREALNHLKQRKHAFEEQISSYHSYIDSAMNTMQRGKGKKRFVIPFTKQFFHLRDLQRTGGEPQFGSYKYSAQYLYERGILLSIDRCSPRQFDRIDIVLSSNEIGIFTIQLINNLPGGSEVTEDIRMENLLQAQFENRVSLSLYDGLAKFNINLLLYQINKKFYV